MRLLTKGNKPNITEIRSDKVVFLGYTEGEVKDTIKVKFKLCHANANANRDRFTVGELENSYKTAKGKAICYGHKKTYIIGFISSSTFVDTENKKAIAFDGNLTDDLSAYGCYDGEDSFIYCEGIIWKSRFPVETAEVIEDFELGNLYFSMESYFDKCKCSVCGSVAYSIDEYCEHLKTRFQNGTDRILMGCTFTGSAKVDSPADKDAVGLAAASKTFKFIDLLGDRLDNEMLEKFIELRLEGQIGNQKVEA
jgi:hypothetical protein